MKKINLITKLTCSHLNNAINPLRKTHCRSYFYFKLIVSLLVLSLFTKIGHAEDPEESEALDETMIEKNIKYSKKIDKWATQLDGYLTGKEKSDEQNKSSVVISNQMTTTEGGVYKYKLNFDIR